MPEIKKIDSNHCDIDDKSSASSASEEKPKPCCSCPETRKLRDDCMFEHGDEEKCKEFIEAHRECMKKLGFNI